MKKLIVDGEMLPRFYAPSYHDWCRQVVVTYPVGLHLVMRWARDLWWWFVRWGFPGHRDWCERNVFEAGRKVGLDNGLKSGEAAGYQRACDDLERFASGDHRN